MLGPPKSRSPRFLQPSSWNRLKFCWITAGLTVILLLAALFSPLPPRYDNYRNSLLHEGHGLKSVQQGYPSEAGANHAYAIFLAANWVQDNEEDINSDNYFVAARVLVYQLLHARETRTVNGYPVVVLVTPKVSERKRERLRKDGATVIEAKPMETGWVKSEISSWQSVMLKLRLWELTQFDLVTFIDADTVLMKPLDDIFNDEEVHTLQTQSTTSPLLPGEAPLPTQYVFAASRELRNNHSSPPTIENGDYNQDGTYANAGFFVLKPSQEVFDYYMSLTKVPEDAGKDGEYLFNPNMPEQNLLNWAHRLDGPMPWKPLPYKWSAHFATVEDAFLGVHSLHAKFWEPAHKEIKPLLERARWKMEGFWEGQEHTP